MERTNTVEVSGVSMVFNRGTARRSMRSPMSTSPSVRPSSSA